jgi:hypothetical protein
MEQLRHNQIQYPHSKIQDICALVSEKNEHTFHELPQPHTFASEHFFHPLSKSILPELSFKTHFLDSLENQKADYLQELRRLASEAVKLQHAEAENHLKNDGEIHDYLSHVLRDIQKVQDEINQKFKENKLIYLLNGKPVYLSDVSQTPEQQRAQLLCMMRGAEKIAEETGQNGYMLTIKLPNWMKVKSKTSKEQARFLSDIWRKVTKNLSNKIIGLSVIEPHRIGFPHLHILLITQKNVFETIKDKLNKLTVDQKAVKQKKKQEKIVNFKDLIGKNRIQKSAFYLTKTLDPENRGYGAFKQENIKKFKVFGAVYGSNALWNFARTFNEQDLKDLQASNPHSTLAKLALSAKTNDSAGFFKLFMSTEKPKPVHLNRDTYDHEFYKHTKSVYLAGFSDSNGNVLTRMYQKAKFSYKSSLQNVGFFSSKNLLNKSRKPSILKGYSDMVIPILINDLGQLAKDISRGLSPSPIGQKTAPKEQNRLLNSPFFLSIKEKNGKINKIQIQSPLHSHLDTFFDRFPFNVDKKYRKYLDEYEPDWIVSYHNNIVLTDLALEDPQSFYS